MSDAETKKERKARLRAEKKANKKPFLERMKNRGREFMSLGKVLVNTPRAFPRAFLDLLRRLFRTVWDARGGGLYACGYVLTFIWLEFMMIVDDIIGAESIGNFFGEQIFEIFFRYFGESLRNMISAFMWPVHVIEISPPWGLAGLVVMFVVFTNFLKSPLEQWLFHDDESRSGNGPL